MTRAFAIILALAATLSAAPAAARDFTVYASTAPILYRYAACMFDGDAPSYEAQLDKCAPMKQRLEAEADAAIDRFHVIERYDVDVELRNGFREIRNDTKQTRRQNRPVPSEIVAYLECMGKGVMATADYKNGDAIDYIGIEQPCYDATIATGNVDDTRQLYLRFQQVGRLTWPAARQARFASNAGNQLRFARRFERSFLNMGFVPHDLDERSSQ